MNKWIKFFILYLGGTTISLSQLKIVPVMYELSEHLGVSMIKTSWLMSVFVISGLLLAIPGGALLSKLGGKKLSFSIILFLLIGNIIGIMSQNFYVLLISRIIEGISFSLIIMTGVVLINYWFPKEKSGLPIGIFGTFSALGSLLAMNAFKPMYTYFGMKSLWLSIIILSLLCLALFSLLDAPKKVIQTTNSGNKSTLLKAAASNKGVWILAFSQGCMSFVLFTFITVYPQIFEGVYNIPPDTANYYSSLFGLFGIPFGTIAGYLIDKTGKPILVSLLSFVILTISTLAINYLTFSTYILQVFFLSASIGIVSTSIFITTSRVVKKEELLGYSISFVNQLYYIGIFIGAPITLWVVAQTSWTEGIYLLTGVGVMGTLGILCYSLITQRK